MKIALTEWNGRIAPVFDVARQAILLDIEDGRVRGEERIALPEAHPHQKVLCLLEHGVAELICGAISCPVRAGAEQAGLKVHGFIAGDCREIVEAWRNQTLDHDRYAMPGCGRRRRCCRRRGENES